MNYLLAFLVLLPPPLMPELRTGEVGTSGPKGSCISGQCLNRECGELGCPGCLDCPQKRHPVKHNGAWWYQKADASWLVYKGGQWKPYTRSLEPTQGTFPEESVQKPVQSYQRGLFRNRPLWRPFSVQEANDTDCFT